MEEESNRRRSSEQISWRGTLLTQAALCLALYGAFSIGTPQESRKPGLMSGRARRRKLMDFYFLSVRGVVWPADEQSQLLQQMSRTAVLYDAKFVVNIDDLGEDDPLLQHASLNFPMLKIPWYTTAGNSTMALSGKLKKYFLKKIKIAYGQILDIIGIETGLFQAHSCRISSTDGLPREAYAEFSSVLSATSSNISELWSECLLEPAGLRWATL